VVYRLAPEFRGARCEEKRASFRSLILSAVRFVPAFRSLYSSERQRGGSLDRGAAPEFPRHRPRRQRFGCRGRERSAFDGDRCGSDRAAGEISARQDAGIAHRLSFASAKLTKPAATLCRGCHLVCAESTAKGPRLSVAAARQSRDARSTDDVPQPNEIVLDPRGLRCPQPVLRARKALRGIPVGGALVFECTDPLTVINVPVFINQTGHALSTQERKSELYILEVVKRR